ncbi:MAG: hypothetical protein HZB43_10850 [candidate division Zixibacteria bacterium]|nr:hypothetical protein [candidate division Zixibacteria bacterium]
MMRFRRALARGLPWVLACALYLSGLERSEATKDKPENVFERSVLKGGLDQTAKDYYAAVWTSLGFFQGADSARRLLAQLDVLNQRRQADSLISILFLPLDTDPVAAGNTFLDGLGDKIAYTRNRGFLHTGGLLLEDVFDHIGLLVLLNGLPEGTIIVEIPPQLCPSDDRVPQYEISWWGENFYFQEDCYGYWRLLGREFPRGGPHRLPPKMAGQLLLNEELISGVAVQDTLPPLRESAVTIQPVSMFDTADWRSTWTVINVGLRARDFIFDSSGWKSLRVRGAVSVRPSGAGSPTALDSIRAALDLGRQKTPRNDLVVLQKIVRDDASASSVGIRERVLGVDIAAGKKRHWKKSILYPVGWIGDSVSVGFGWLLNPRVLDNGYLGGRPPLVQNLIAPGDSLVLFFQLTGTSPHEAQRYRTHVRLRFIREEDRKWEVVLSELYRLGKEPLDSRGGKDITAAATQVAVLETPSANANVTLGTYVPDVRDGHYRIVGECYQTSGGDARPFALVIFDGIQIKRRDHRASN